MTPKSGCSYEDTVAEDAYNAFEYTYFYEIWVEKQWFKINVLDMARDSKYV